MRGMMAKEISKEWGSGTAADRLWQQVERVRGEGGGDSRRSFAFGARLFVEQCGEDCIFEVRGDCHVFKTRRDSTDGLKGQAELSKTSQSRDIVGALYLGFAVFEVKG